MGGILPIHHRAHSVRPDDHALHVLEHPREAGRRWREESAACVEIQLETSPGYEPGRLRPL